VRGRVWEHGGGGSETEGQHVGCRPPFLPLLTGGQVLCVLAATGLDLPASNHDSLRFLFYIRIRERRQIVHIPTEIVSSMATRVR
jgi:hypothetical protein